MPCKADRPRWALLYAILPIAVGVFWLDSRAHLSAQGHTLLQLGILLAAFGLAQAWLTVNRGAMIRAGASQRQARYTTYLLEEPAGRLIQPPYEAILPDGASPVQAPFASREGDVPRNN